MLEQADISSETEPADEPPFLRLPGDPACGCLLICDHAVNRVPEEYDGLGMDAAQMQRHIAYDIGAAGVTTMLSELMRAPAVLANFSRLLIDPNRGEDDPTLVMRLSDGAVVPGNADVDAAEIERRRRLYYEPYHKAVDAAVDEALATDRVPVLLSIHTFTDSWRGRARAWDAGILWDRDPRLARPLIDVLARDPSLHVGDNEPYTGKLLGDCMYRHGTERGLANALVEIRQDLVRERSGQEEWAARLARAMEEILTAPGVGDTLHKIEFFGSWSEAPSPSAEAAR